MKKTLVVILLSLIASSCAPVRKAIVAQGYPCALPDHLKERLHNDWPGPLKELPRSLNARGPRCGQGNPGYLPWPPKLVEGFGVARWETDGATSIIEIPALANRYVDSSIYGQTFEVIERKPGHPNFGQKWMQTLTWVEGLHEGQYSPSALQKFSIKGWIRLSPDYRSSWKILIRREEPGKETGEDTVKFSRTGFRPDTLDLYYNFGPMAGLKWE